MPADPLKELSEIKGVIFEGNPADRELALKLLRASLPIAYELIANARRTSPLSAMAGAALASFQTVSALITSAAARCNLAAPPEDIDVKIDGDGNMVYRCQHSPSHQWDLNGRRQR